MNEQPTAEQTPLAHPEVIGSVWHGLHIILVGMLIALLLFTSIVNPTPQTIVGVIVFALVFGAGEFVAARAMHARRAHLSDENAPMVAMPTVPSKTSALWMLALIATFSWLVYTTKDAAFIAFPLFFLVVHVAGGWIAAACVALITAISVFGIGLHGQWSVGAVLGPVIGGLAALTVGLGLRLLFAEVEARSLAIKELVAARAEVEKVSRRAGELDERARLASDIHDTVAQGLSSIQLLLHSAEKKAGTNDPQLKDTIRLARTTAADNLAETRRIIAALQPAPLVGATLPVALARLCSTTTMGDKITFSVDGQAEQLDQSTESALVRLTQSLLANVVKHSQATEAKVTLTYQPDMVLLDVVDNGIGFDPDHVPEDSFGLLAARRRVAELGGTMTIETAQGAGTGVSVCVPFEEGSERIDRDN